VIRINYIIISLSVLIIVISSLLLYKYYPVLEAYYYNREISISGVKLLMTEEELNSSFEEDGEFVPGMGGNGWRFSKEKIFVMTSSIGLFKDKVSSIDTENSSHSILGIKIGDNYDSASSVLEKHGFKESSDYIFRKGNVLIQLNSGSRISRMRISIQDPAYKDVVF